MPNHVINKLTVTGPECSVNRMKNAVCGKDHLDAQHIIPMPFKLATVLSPNNDQKLIDEFVEKYGAPDWYRWCVKNWGTKWGFYDVSKWKNKNEQNSEFWKDTDIMTDSIIFHTAWSPPLPLIREIAHNFPSLTFVLEYVEDGMGFAGEFTVTNDIEDDIYFDDHNSIEFKKIQHDLDFNFEEV